MKKLFYLLLSALLFPFYTALAQEVVTPLGSNRNLQSSVEAKMPQLQKKAIGVVPIVDFFTQNTFNTNNWLKGHCSISYRWVVFNALDSTGAAHTTSDAEVLTSKDWNSSGAQNLFVSFSYQRGVNAIEEDSLLLFAKNNVGEWVPIWRNPNSSFPSAEVIVDLPKSAFAHATLAFQFVSYTNNLVSSNALTFAISKFVVANKWKLNTYEHLRELVYPDSLPTENYFAAPDVKLVQGNALDYVWGNCALIDHRDVAGTVYGLPALTYGGADTIYSHPIPVSAQLGADSLFVSFTLKAAPVNTPGDSFIVEFYNNLGQWVRAFAITGNAPATFTTYTFPVNNGRNRHANFKFRLYGKLRYDAPNPASWLVSGFRYTKKISLPFFDDFANARTKVSAERWRDTLVFVNNDFPEKHPSINVATFDGLDAYGNAYSKFATKGVCDVLTSHGMNLKGLTTADSVILSFYFQYEPQGTTNQIYPDDVLVLEFRHSAMDPDSFTTIAEIEANDTLLFKFTKFQIAITQAKYFHEDFQFRLKNIGSLTGNLSQWHVDYIRFNKSRKLNDPLKDLALTNTPPVMLGAYTSMPWYQYENNKGKYGNGAMGLRLVNHDNQNYAVDYFRSVMKPEGDTLDKFNNILPSIKALSDSVVPVAKPFNFATAVQADSLVFQTRYRIKISGNQNDNVTGNDTFSVPTIFSNYYAYDDGTAEGGYGIKNKTNVGAALKYEVEVPDSIVGFYIFFNQSEKDVSVQPFSLKIWKNISPRFLPATSDVVLYSQEMSKPTYTNTLNGFTAYRLLQAVPVTDSFFVGWEQTSAFVLNVGLDKNYRFGLNQNMFYKMDGRWYPTEIPGALMFRPIMKKFLGAATGFEAIEKSLVQTEWSVYPNPANDVLNIQINDLNQYDIRLFDIMGKQLQLPACIENTLSVQDVPAGFYVLSLTHRESQQTLSKKIIINK